MKRILAFKTTVILALIFSTVTCFASIDTAGTDKLAPRATRYEAEIKHWRQPELKKRFWDIPILKEAFIDITPDDIGDGLRVGKLGIDGGNKQRLIELAQEIAEGQHGLYDSLLVLHQGQLLFESYFRRGRIDLPHPQSSVTKAYTGLALGRAIQLGYIRAADLDKPIASFLRDLQPDKFTQGAENITLHRALTMTTGLRISDEHWLEIRSNPEKVRGQGEVQALFEYSAPITLKSKTFYYDIGPQLIMQVIDAVVPDTAESFIKNELLGKMGISNFDWKIAASGLPESIWKSSLTSRDMAKIGLLVANKGKWNNKQLVPESFINKAVSRIVNTGDEEIFGGGNSVSNQGYGYYWWSSDLKHNDKSYYSVSAQGGGGEYIVWIEELALLVIVTAHHTDERTQQLIADRILPAFVQ